MYQYYAAPLRRKLRSLYLNPLGGDCVLAPSPSSACLQLGLPGAGGMFAVWAVHEGTSLEEAGQVCSLTPPTRAFVCVGDGIIFPLALDPALDIYREVSSAGGY